MAKCIIEAADGRDDIVIYSNYLESINAFLSTPLQNAETDPWAIRTKNIPGHQRRKGPSDANPVNVRQSTATYLFDPSLKSGNAKPGFSFILKTDPEFADVDMQRQFTMVGRVVDFVSYFDKKMKYDTFYYPQIGGRHKLLETPLGN